MQFWIIAPFHFTSYNIWTWLNFERTKSEISKSMLLHFRYENRHEKDIEWYWNLGHQLKLWIDYWIIEKCQNRQWKGHHSYQIWIWIWLLQQIVYDCCYYSYNRFYNIWLLQQQAYRNWIRGQDLLSTRWRLSIQPAAFCLNEVHRSRIWQPN